MANSKAKGKRIEDMMRKHMEALGWYVHQAIASGTKRGNIYTSNTNDIFGCIDLLCKHHDEDVTFWLQTTTKNGMSARVKKVREADIPWKETDRVAVVGYYGAKDYKGNTNGPFYLYRWLHEDFEIIHDDEHRLYKKDMELE